MSTEPKVDGESGQRANEPPSGLGKATAEVGSDTAGGDSEAESLMSRSPQESAPSGRVHLLVTKNKKEGNRMPVMGWAAVAVAAFVGAAFIVWVFVGLLRAL